MRDLRPYRPVKIGPCDPHGRIVRVLAVHGDVVTITDQVTWLPERVAIAELRPAGVNPLPGRIERVVGERAERALSAASNDAAGSHGQREPSRHGAAETRRPTDEPVRPLTSVERSYDGRSWRPLQLELVRGGGR